MLICSATRSEVDSFAPGVPDFTVWLTGTKDGLEGYRSERTFRPGCRHLPQPYLYVPDSPHKDFVLFIHGMDLNVSLDEGGFAQAVPSRARGDGKSLLRCNSSTASADHVFRTPSRDYKHWYLLPFYIGNTI